MNSYLYSHKQIIKILNHAHFGASMKCVQTCLDVTVTFKVTVTLVRTFYP